MKKKRLNKRRTINLQFKAAKPFNQLRINHDTGQHEALMDGVLVEGALTNVVASVTYARAKGPKVITAIPQGKHGAHMSPYSFVEHYDVVFAVDTNSRQIGTALHSIAAMAILEIQNIKRGPSGQVRKVDANMNMFGALIRGCNIHGNPEPWFWRVAIEDGIKKLYPKYTPALRIGLVVDSDLANLEKYNQRTLPLHENYLLPENITLIYASADTGGDFVPNQLLKLCDREASLQLDKMERGIVSNEVLTSLDRRKTVRVPGTPFRFY